MGRHRDWGNIEDLRRFYDRYLKDEDNGWESTPRVRYSVLDPGGKDDTDRTADTWPPVAVPSTTLHLDAASGRLTKEQPATESSVSYASTDPTASATFRCTIEEETELLGPLNVRLWIETSEGDDLDLFAAVYKTDATGKPLHHFVFPALKDFVQSLEQDGRLPPRSPTPVRSAGSAPPTGPWTRRNRRRWSRTSPTNARTLSNPGPPSSSIWACGRPVCSSTPARPSFWR